MAEPGQSRAAFLKQRTAGAHAALEARIEALRPFASRERYALFLRAQLAFHQYVEPLYRQAPTAHLLPDNEHRSRLGRVEADLADLGATAGPGGSADFGSLPERLGWLYVAEGSKLGAAVLLKAVDALGLHGDFGARHLAADDRGRGLSWRRFTATLNDQALSPADDRRVAEAANDAFRFFADQVERIFGEAGAPIPAGTCRPTGGSPFIHTD